MPFSVVLIHSPVFGRFGERVTSTITNLDVHDIARSAKTFGAKNFVLIHPVLSQRKLVEKICDHWRNGPGGKRIPSRALALELVRTLPSLDELYAEFGGRDAVCVWTTGAKKNEKSVSYTEAKTVRIPDLLKRSKHLLLLFGTSWGLTPETMELADASLEPISSQIETNFNHLSVRSAVAISLDRLFGKP